MYNRIKADTNRVKNTTKVLDNTFGNIIIDTLHCKRLHRLYRGTCKPNNNKCV